MKIHIKESKTADTRTCDVSKVSKEQLLISSKQHIDDVAKGMLFFETMLGAASLKHDHDKISGIDSFHADFLTKFEKHDWWDNHKEISRHHLLDDAPIPDDVNLIDVLEMIVDCVMAGMARSGDVCPLEIPADVLLKAFNNTADLLKSNIIIEKDENTD